jgi:hypothetical protein
VNSCNDFAGFIDASFIGAFAPALGSTMLVLARPLHTHQPPDGA